MDQNVGHGWRWQSPAWATLALVGVGALAIGLSFTIAGRSQDASEMTLVGPDISKTSDVPFRTDTVLITIGGLIDNYGALEYKISMNEGDVVSYSWTASSEIHYEFHGHSAIVEGQPVRNVNWYRVEDGTESHGAMVAPVTGIHGWYFLNPSFDEPIEIELKLSGYYRLEPGVLKSRSSLGAAPPTQ